MTSNLKSLSFRFADHRLWEGAWLIWHQNQLHYCVGNLWIENWQLMATDIVAAWEELFVSDRCKHTIIKPSTEAWRTFWATLKQLDIEAWHTTYSNESVLDGSGWTLQIEHDDWQIQRSGNLFPANFCDFCNAVSTLIGSPEFNDLCQLHTQGLF